MYQQFNRYKILSIFFDSPNKKFQLRELSRISKISLPSVKKHVKGLLEQKLIKKINKGLYDGYKSNFCNKYRLLKRNDLLLRIETSGLSQEIENRCTPNCIVLYGSAVEGMDDERGDVDIFIQSIKKDIEIKKYENILKREINLLFEPYIENVDSKLKNSLANGIVLHGFLKVV